MSIPRFYAFDLSADSIPLDPAEARHATGSRRLRPGDEVEVFDGRGGVARGRLRDGKPSVEIDERRHEPPPAATLTLFVAAPKGERLRWMIEKCTELGVSRIVLTRFERSVVLPREQKVEKCNRYAVEACKQCGRNYLPHMEADMPLAAAVTASRPTRSSRLALADAGPDASSIASWLEKLGEGPHQASIIIGPEGGLSADERSSLLEHGVPRVRLANHILRTETAAVAAGAIWAAFH